MAAAVGNKHSTTRNQSKSQSEQTQMKFKLTTLALAAMLSVSLLPSCNDSDSSYSSPSETSYALPNANDASLDLSEYGFRFNSASEVDYSATTAYFTSATGGAMGFTVRNGIGMRDGYGAYSVTGTYSGGGASATLVLKISEANAPVTPSTYTIEGEVEVTLVLTAQSRRVHSKDELMDVIICSVEATQVAGSGKVRQANPGEPNELTDVANPVAWANSIFGGTLHIEDHARYNDYYNN